MRAKHYDPARRWGCVTVMTLWILAAALLCVSLCGCAPTKYVPVETVRTEYRDRDVERLVTDTVRDTRLIVVRGDTVVDIRDRWHTQRLEVHDTICIVRTDSAQVPYPVERQLSRWEQAKMDLGGIAIGGVGVILCIAVVWLARKFRK